MSNIHAQIPEDLKQSLISKGFNFNKRIIEFLQSCDSQKNTELDFEEYTLKKERLDVVEEIIRKANLEKNELKHYIESYEEKERDERIKQLEIRKKINDELTTCTFCYTKKPVKDLSIQNEKGVICNQCFRSKPNEDLKKVIA